MDVLPSSTGRAPDGRREFDIDAFRGLVCLSLVTLHFYVNGPLHDGLHRLIGSVGDFLVHHVRLGVESFFLLAGFMMAHMLRPAPGENVSVRGYLTRRFFRLIIPYWIAVLLAALDRWAVLVVFQRGDVPAAGDVIAQMSLTQEFFAHAEDVAPTGYWSMVTLEQFYLVWLVGYWICRKLLGQGTGGYGPAEQAMAWLTLAAGLVSAIVLASDEWTRFRLPRYALYLSLGLMLYWCVRQRFARVPFVIGLVALAAVAVYTGKSRPIAGLASVALLIPLCRGWRLPSAAVLRFLALWGRRSYSLYLMHPIVGIRLLSFGKFAADGEPAVLLGVLAAAFVGTFIAAEVFYRLVELPCQARARQVNYRGRNNPAASGP